MGCAFSRKEDDVVTLCKERKHFLKLAIKRRKELADEHSKYINSFSTMASAIRLFIARHSSPSSPFLLTFHPPESASQPIDKEICDKQSADESSICPHFYTEIPSEPASQPKGKEICEEQSPEECSIPSETPPKISPPYINYKWHFFNPYDRASREVIGESSHSSKENFREMMEVEGTAKLEEEGKTKGESMAGIAGNNDNKMTVIATPEDDRELLKALKEVEEQFLKSHNSLKGVYTKMLETDTAHLKSGLQDIQDNSIKHHAIKWYQSPFSRSSSSQSFLSSSPNQSSTCIERKKDIIDDHGRTELECHLLTLERLYAWEKKLYEEVKVGEHAQKIYKQKCAELGNQEVDGDCIKESYNRILVSIRTAEITSKRIHNLRDKELQFQLIEQLEGLVRTWKTMWETHESQKLIMAKVKSFNGPAYGKFCDESHRLATLQLEAELQNWHTCFTRFIAAQRAYVKALNGWLSRFLVPEVEFYSRSRALVPPNLFSGPLILMICHDWLTSLEKLPDKAVRKSIERFCKCMWELWVQQGMEHQQKRKVEFIAKELDRKVRATQRTENKILEDTMSGEKTEQDLQHQTEDLAAKTNQLNKFRRKLDAEKAKHHSSMQETQKITINGLQTGLTSIFESLADFSKASLNMYTELISSCEKAKLGDKGSKPSNMETPKFK